MALQSLLLTRDPEVRRQLCSVLRDLGIGAEVCEHAGQARERLRRRHFDLAVLDSEVAGVEAVIAELRIAPSSQRAPLFVIGPADGSVAPVGSDADQVLTRPLALEKTWRALRSARQRMESSMFRYYRVRVDAPVFLLRSDGSTLAALTSDVSKGGIGLQGTAALDRGEILDLQFDLSGCREVLTARAVVVWADRKDKAGLRFLGLEDKCRSALDDWIAQAMGKREFAFVFSTPEEIPTPALIALGETAS